MSYSMYSERQQALAEEKRVKYRGSASVKLEVLHFHCEPDPQNIQRLKKLFKKSGCDRADVRNHVPVIITSQSLHTAIQDAGLSPDKILESQGCYTKLDFPPSFQLQCLHGIIRVQAVSHLPCWGDQRWVVDLYLEGELPLLCILHLAHASKLTKVTDSNCNLRTALAEEYACERQLDDGEIYCKIRQHQKLGHAYFKQRWLARLEAIGERKLQNMNRILKHPKYRSAFDCQIDMPGLAGGMILGTVHQMYAMKCDEVRSSCFSV
jgi:hypothetical protein